MNAIKIQNALEDHQEIFKKLSHFTAPIALGEKNLPQLILDNLVEHALFLQNNPIVLDKVLELVESQFKLTFDRDEIRESLDRLLLKKVVVKNNGNFSIEARHRADLQEISKGKIRQEQKIQQKLLDSIKIKYPKLSEEQLNQIKSDFQKFLVNFFLIAGAEAVQLIYGNPGQIKNLTGRVYKKNIFDLLPQRPTELRQIEQKEFSDFVNLLSKDEKVYLQDLLDKSLQYFTVTVDKKCEALLAANFKDWNLFVDTNFIYGLIGLHSGTKRKNAEKILELGKKVGIKFFVSPATLEEFVASVTEVRELLLENKISRRLYKIAGEITGNTILSAYYEVQKKNNIGPKDFLAKIENIKDILKSYEIDEKTDYSQSIKGTKEFNDTVQKMATLTGKGRHIAEHDTFHYLLILKLRNREGADNRFQTNKSWFLTHDSLLAPFDYELRKAEIPFCVRPYQFRQILRPIFSRTDNFESVFIDFVTEPMARAFPAVSADMAINVLARITYYEKEFGLQNSPELAIKILTNQHFVNQLRDLRAEEGKQFKLINDEIKRVAQIQETQIVTKDQQEPKKINYWNFLNPFWLLWQLLKMILALIKKYKAVSIISGVIVSLGLIATDYTLAWRNLKIVWEVLKRLF